MMDLLGAGNPYMARRFAEGGEASNRGPDVYGMAWDRLVQPGVSEAMEKFQAEKLALEQQIPQANERAAQQAQASVDAIINSAMQRVQQRYQPQIQSLQEQIQGLQDYKAGKVDSVRILAGTGSRMTTIDTTGVPRDSEYVDGRLRNITQKLERLPEQIRSEAFYEVDNEQFGGRLGGDQQEVRNQLLAIALPQAESSIVRPILGQLEQLNQDFTDRMLSMHLVGDQRAKQASADLYAYNRSRFNEVENEIQKLKASGAYTPEQEQIIRDAYSAEGQYLFGSDYDFTPEGQERSRQLYNQAIQTGIVNRPSLIPSTPAMPTQPEPVPTAPTVPGVPPPTSVPIPVLGQQPATPGAPVSNLTPQPMPGITAPPSIGGVPQPSLGIFGSQSALPTYQTPQTQAPSTTQQQPQIQIQYGPIGQAATSSSDLLKNLLAATQQSSPYDFTKNNPYLMQNEPVQFFAEGGEVKPPAQPVVNVQMDWFNNPSYWISNSPEFKRGVEAYGGVSAFKSALERYNRDYAQYVINYAESELSKGRYTPGAVASAYEQAASSPVFSSGERENFLAKAASFNTQQQRLDEANAAQRAAQDLVISRFQAFNPLEQELTKKAYEEYENRKNYFQGLFQQQKQDLLQQYLNTPGPKDRAAYTKSIDQLSMQDDIETAAAREALDKNLAFIRGTREQMRLGDVDTSNLMLPYLFTKPEPVPVQEPPPTLVPTTPTTPTTPAPVETTPAPSPIPAPVINQQPTTPAPTIPTAPQIPISNLTPQPLPVGGIPQPSFGVFGSQNVLPTYQTPQPQAPSPMAQAQPQQPQQQIQYGPIGQGAVGQTNLLNTLLSNQQDPTKVSLLGFDNPYLIKPFG